MGFVELFSFNFSMFKITPKFQKTIMFKPN